MHLSTKASLLALSTLILLATSPPGDNHGAVVSATLTPQERLEVEAKDPDNPNYCPACLKKALFNHFPHACPKDLEPWEATTRPEGPRPNEQRCICIAFVDLFWMKRDCEQECTFVNNPAAMAHFQPAEDIPGCDKWIDFATGQENQVEGFEPRNPSHQPEVYVPEDTEAETEASQEETVKDKEEEQIKKREENGPEEEVVEATEVKLEGPRGSEDEPHIQGEVKAEKGPKDEL
ncbi:hypothetical protein BC939DRAFT_477916 [Gamsiella multidivaricata]|uniref:uncharacterized protein n=1 Tax=Gamsiella multidivaricata TaxID=101098 RepID=UPI00221E8C9C|nr:uncharacterized protein BC939DRAFT_477916 [Gamsiella multidivaricata]KAG0371114.1 hypothetical protein BGZ54_000058 [Gamsiella multidivaricata]KAI7822182.1 hypothetical protein BC939DRAFT_477916 [Gamsiella multidivaricata]